MTSDPVTIEKVLELIDAYGADIDLWPEAVQDTGRAAIEATPEAFAAALADAQRLDAALGELGAPEPPQRLFDSIMADGPQRSAIKPPFGARLASLVLPQGRKWPAAAAIASTMFGMAAGYGGMATAATAQYEAEAALFAMFESGADFELGDLDG